MKLRYITIALAAVCSLQAGPVELLLPPSNTDNIFFPAEEKFVTVDVRNGSAEAKTLEVLISGRIDDGTTFEVRREAQVGAGGRETLRVPVELREPAFAEIQARVRNPAGEDLAEKRTTLAVVRPQDLAGIPFTEAFYGFSFFVNPDVSARIGGRFIRTIMHWKFTEPSLGRYNFQEFTSLGERAEAAGVGMIYTFGMFIRPDDLGKPGIEVLAEEPSLERFEKWVEAGTRILPKKAAAVEISNEPDLDFAETHKLDATESARLAGQLLKRGYRVVKSVSPNTPVLGAGVSGVDFHKSLSFARTMLEEAGGDVDYLSPHPYADARYLDGAKSTSWPDSYPLISYLEQAAVLAREFTKGRAVWSTELGWGVPVKENFLSPITTDFAALHGQVLVLFKTVPGVEKISLFVGQIDWLERGMNYSLFVREGKGNTRWRPLPSVSAYATVTSLLEGSETGRKLETGPGVRAYLFDNPRTGRTIAAVWAAKSDVSFSGNLPAETRLVNLFGRESSAKSGGPLTVTRAPQFFLVPSAQAKALEKDLTGADWKPERPFVIDHPSAPAPHRLACEIENLLPHPVEAEVSIAGVAANAKLQPGKNLVEVEIPPLGTAKPVLDIPVQVKAGELAATANFSRKLLHAPFIKDLRADGEISETEAAALTGTLQDRGDVLPPDPAVPWTGPEDLSARYGWAWNEEGLYLAVIATDDKHVIPPASQANFWDYDSLQVAYVPGAKSSESFSPGDREIGLAVAGDGAASLSQTVPPKSDPLGHPAAVRRSGQETVYEIFLPWDYFFGKKWTPAAGTTFSANFILNDNDGSGRAYWMGISDGIASGKYPAYYPWLMILPKDHAAKETQP